MNVFADSTLVLLGHGSTVNAESGDPTWQHAQAIRARKLFARVIEGFWKQEPAVCGVLRGAITPTVFIVPLFISEGYFTEEVLPRELGFPKRPDGRYETKMQRNGQTFHFCEPVGTHPSMTAVLLQRAKSIVEQYPFPILPKMGDTSLFIAGHGTGNNENSRKAIEAQVKLIGEMNLYGDVHGIFMEEEPKIADCYRLASRKNVVMVPFFISDGLHSYEDIPVMPGEPERVVKDRYKAGQPTWRNPTEKNGKRLWYTPAIGTEPCLIEVILERVEESALLS